MPRFEGDDEDDAPTPAKRPRGLPEIRDKRCLVCQSAYRKDMERLMVTGLSYSEIARWFEGLGENITRKSLSNHREKHMWLEAAAVAGLIEDRARQAMMDVEEHKGFLLTKRAMLEIMLQQGYKDVIAGISQVEPKDLLAVIEKLEKMESEQKQVAVDEMMRDFQAFADAVKLFCDDDQQRLIFGQYEKNLDLLKAPILEQLITLELPPPKKEDQDGKKPRIVTDEYTDDEAMD